MTLNPDFRGSDEIEVPKNLRDMCGWSDIDDPDLNDLIDFERRAFGELEEAYPARFQTQIPQEIEPAMKARWDQFQQSKGRYPGSADWSLLDEFVHGEPLLWKPQIIGSCVCSNTLRPWAARLMYQITLVGDPMEYLGRSEFGPENYSFYGPFTYGHARKKANMRRGDGLYCAPMAWSLMQGVLKCDTPQLLRILQSRGLADSTDFPEPQGRDGASFYREMGNWKFIDELSQYIDFAMEESPTVRSGDQLWDLLQDGKPSFVCSGEAIHKIGEHPDGFAIHARNPRDSWAHNMSFQGALVASDGERFIRQCNQSWGEKHIYTRRLSEVDKAIRSGGLTIQSIGKIAGPSSSPPLIQ